MAIVTDKTDFSPNGHKVFYWENGNKRMEGTWEDGKRVSKFTFYNKDGSINIEVNFDKDVVNKDTNRYVRGKLVMTYGYADGTLINSTEYLNNTKIGEYSYTDALVYPDPNDPEAPPIGTIFHSYNGVHPAELYKGTLWTFVQTDYKIDENGKTNEVAVWLREPNGGRGPYIYEGQFKEYRSSNGSLLRSGSYVRKLIEGEASISVLNGAEHLYRENGSRLYHANWSNGIKVDKVEFVDSKDRVWKSVKLDHNSKYVEGTYDIWDIGLDGSITYDFDPLTQVAHLRLLK